MHATSITPLLQLGHGGGLPESPPEDYESQDEFLKSAHHALMEVCGVTVIALSLHRLPNARMHVQ